MVYAGILKMTTIFVKKLVCMWLTECRMRFAHLMILFRQNHSKYSTYIRHLHLHSIFSAGNSKIQMSRFGVHIFLLSRYAYDYGSRLFFVCLFGFQFEFLFVSIMQSCLVTAFFIDCSDCIEIAINLTWTRCGGQLESNGSKIHSSFEFDSISSDYCLFRSTATNLWTSNLVHTICKMYSHVYGFFYLWFMSREICQTTAFEIIILFMVSVSCDSNICIKVLSLIYSQIIFGT